jgi:hypothetical protein
MEGESWAYYPGPFTCNVSQIVLRETERLVPQPPVTEDGPCPSPVASNLVPLFQLQLTFAEQLNHLGSFKKIPRARPQPLEILK